MFYKLEIEIDMIQCHPGWLGRDNIQISPANPALRPD